MADRLVIFDYSGTLSLEAVRFGRPEILGRHLKRSGLADLGIDTGIYWERIVAPTWHEASTTAAGFAPMLARLAHAMGGGQAPAPAARMAAHRFVSAYIRNSVIDPRWKPALTTARAHPQTLVVVATDHYAEATAGIARHLEALGITAKAAMEVQNADLPQAFIVANSADMGYHKARLPFWEKLAARLGPLAIDRILLVDDFGGNETGQSDYANARAVARRKNETQAVIRQGLAVPVTPLPFSAGQAPDDLDRRIQNACRIISDFLTTP